MKNQVLLGIVDDHPLMRTGIAALISEFDGFKILFEASNGLEMQHQLKAGRVPEVILMDIRMPGMDGYESTAWLKAQYPAIKVLALTMFHEADAIVGMLKNGACGYIMKDSRPSEIVYAITAIKSRGVFLNEHVSGKLLHSIQNPSGTKQIDNLTVKEHQFLQLCCSELTYKEIAYRMGLSPHTVENYREALFRKLEVKSRGGIIIYAVKNKLVKL